MLTVRFGQLTVEGLSPSKIYSLAGCSQTPSRLFSIQWLACLLERDSHPLEYTTLPSRTDPNYLTIRSSVAIDG